MTEISKIVTHDPVEVVEVGIAVENGFEPERQHRDEDAGYDLFAPEGGTVFVGQKLLVPLGIWLEIPRGWEGQIRSRSGNAKKFNVFVVNQPGTIDSGYRDEVGVMLFNLGPHVFVFKRGDRIAQLLVKRVPDVVFKRRQRSEMAKVVRHGGFGSTGA